MKKFFMMAIILSKMLYSQILTTSNLPIISIDTRGQTIVNEPDIIAKMGVIYNGPGKMNNITDPFNNYDGFINIEHRGNTSLDHAKKPFAVETADSLGVDIDASIMGLPLEEDWILNNVCYDHTFLRNILTFKMWGEMGHPTVKTKPCEVIINGQYQGVYVFMEKIKRDTNRVNIAKLKEADTTGVELTGGYILKLDWQPEPVEGMTMELDFKSSYNTVGGKKLPFIYVYPKAKNINIAQKNYIKEYMNDFESALINSSYINEKGKHYSSYIDLTSFIDFFLINEFSKNTDGYRLSTFLHKDKDRPGKPGVLQMGPVWDFNFAWFGADYNGSDDPTGWSYNFPGMSDEDFMPFWWNRLTADADFNNYCKTRWVTLRKTILSESYLFSWIDSMVAVLEEPQKRNSSIWATDIDGNPVNYAQEISELKEWIIARGKWLDSNLPGVVSNSTIQKNSGVLKSTIIPAGENVQITLYNCLGRSIKKMRSVKNIDCDAKDLMKDFSRDFNQISGSVYFYEIRGTNGFFLKGKILNK